MFFIFLCWLLWCRRLDWAFFFRFFNSIPHLSNPSYLFCLFACLLGIFFFSSLHLTLLNGYNFLPDSFGFDQVIDSISWFEYPRSCFIEFLKPSLELPNLLFETSFQILKFFTIITSSRRTTHCFLLLPDFWQFTANYFSLFFHFFTS